MKRFTKQKGITLIALVITIIVMLILVGVTINIAVNSGLFDKASEAKIETQKERDKELLLSALVATIDNDGNYNLAAMVLPEGFSEQGGIYTNDDTGNQYTINSATGEIEDYTGTNPESETNVWYDLGLTTSNARCNLTYVRTTGEIGATSFIAYSDGTFSFNGGSPMTISEMETALSGTITLGENYILFDLPGNSVSQLTVFDGQATATMYQKPYTGPYTFNYSTFISSADYTASYIADISGDYYEYSEVGDSTKVIQLTRTGYNAETGNATYTGSKSGETFSCEVINIGTILRNITQSYEMDIYYDGDTVYLMNKTLNVYITNDPDNLFIASIPAGEYVKSDNTQRIVVNNSGGWEVQNSSDNGLNWTEAHSTYYKGAHCGIIPGTSNTALFVGMIDSNDRYLLATYNDNAKTITIDDGITLLVYTLQQ